MPWCIVYLASPKDRCINECLGGHRKFDILQASLRITKRLFPTQDIYIFHEDFGREEMDALPPVKEYVQVNFQGYDDVFVKHEFPKGYILMCRFFSGQIQRLPQLRRYTHYMRLDDDSYFMEPFLTKDAVDALCGKGDYIYRSVFFDVRDHQSLFEFTLAFLESKGYGTQLPEMKRWLEQVHVTQNQVYTGMAPYNNFHIASLRLWSHPVVSEYVDRLEEVHGCLRHGWLDANIHAMIAWVIGPLIGARFVHTGSFGYRHNKHISLADKTDIEWKDELPFYPS